MKQYNYLFFHLPMLQEIFTDPQNAFSNIFDVAIYNVSTKMAINQENMYKQILYCYHREELTKSLENKLIQWRMEGYMNLNPLYPGFREDQFIGDKRDIAFLHGYGETSLSFYKEMCEFYRLRQAKAVLEMKFGIDSVIHIYKMECAKYNSFKEQPVITIKKDMMFDYYLHSKTETDKALFAMYAGIRSIIGQKEFAATTSDMIKCRMFGAKNRATLEQQLKNRKDLKKAYKKYSIRYQYEKLLNQLLGLNFISAKIGYNRRTYLSIRLDHDRLADAIIHRHQEGGLKKKIKNLKDKELEARNKLLQHLNKETS